MNKKYRFKFAWCAYTREAVLNVWVTTPWGMNDPLTGVTQDQWKNTNIYIMNYNSSKTIVIEKQ